MTPYQRARCITELVKVLPLPAECAQCDPNGGCANDVACRTEIAETVMDVIELEMAVS
jgi:hypothetical protein